MYFCVQKTGNMDKENNNGYRHILKYTSVFGSVQGLNIMAALVRNKFAAVLLGSVGMGFASLLLTWQNFITQTTNLGISFGAVPSLSELYERKDELGLRRQIVVIRTWSLLAAVLGAFLCMVASPLMNMAVASSQNQTLYFALVAPAIAMMAIAGGETAILKATRQLKALAKVQLVATLASVVVSIPLYYLMGVDGVVPVMILMALVTMFATIGYSYRRYPMEISLSRQIYADGRSMVLLGIAFSVAAIVGQVGEIFLRLFLNNYGELSEVGLYNAAYTLTVSYSALVLAAVESDFFPRLSAVCRDRWVAVDVVNRQVEVLVLLLSPMLTALIVLLPLLVPMLYTGQFSSIVPMAQLSAIAMFFKSLSLPVCYLPLANKDSRSFLVLEISYWVYFLALFAVGYMQWGLWGTGVAIVVAHAIEWLMAVAWTYKRYQYRLSSSMMQPVVCQMLLVGLTYLVSVLLSGYYYWIVGCFLMTISIAYSCCLLYRKRKG